MGDTNENVLLGSRASTKRIAVAIFAEEKVVQLVGSRKVRAKAGLGLLATRNPRHGQLKMDRMKQRSIRNPQCKGSAHNLISSRASSSLSNFSRQQ